MKRKLFTVFVFAKLNTRRYFRDKTAMFFTILFPLIFLFVFGGLFGNSASVSFSVAVFNQSQSKVASDFVASLNHQGKLFKVSSDVSSIAQANDKMSHGQLDAAIVLPKSFGEQQKGQTFPSGQATVYYTQNNQQAAQTLTSVLQSELQTVNLKFVKNPTPFTVTSQQNGHQGLRQFDYTFAGLLGFAIMGLGIFGPVNVFPELKKQGILRRFHTTPLRVWQYFLSTMVSQAIIGLLTIAILFSFAIKLFHLKVVGNYAELGLFLVLGIVMILGIGLAIGGWASNERQAAPLGNIVTFPMMFLSGTFFPRYIMPEWLQHITGFLPLTPVIDGIRLIATEGKSLAGIAPQIGLVGLWTVVVYVIAFRVFRWE